MQIGKNRVVTLEYVLRDESGAVIDDSKASEPLTYLHGVGNIVPGLERALEGRSRGEQLRVAIPPEDSFGARDESRVQVHPRGDFEEIEDLRPGMMLQRSCPEGVRVFTVTSIEGTEVTVDGNHPLAGVALDFEITVTDVREATAEELSEATQNGLGEHEFPAR